MSDAPKCRHCGHTEADHDGYGGLCDGLGYNDSREVCGCDEFIPIHRRRPRRSRPSGEVPAPDAHHADFRAPQDSMTDETEEM